MKQHNNPNKPPKVNTALSISTFGFNIEINIIEIKIHRIMNPMFLSKRNIF